MVFKNLPEISLIETGIPIKEISELARKEGNSKKPIYTIHKWWARRLSGVVRALILGIVLPRDATEQLFWDAYYQSNDLSNLTVLDAFMGGGTCIVESKKMRARTIGIDIDPLACFVTKKEIEPFAGNQLTEDYNNVITATEKIVSKFYQTQVDGRCAEVVNFFWAYDITCQKCDEHTVAHPHYYLAKDTTRITAFCKHCGHVKVLPANRKRFTCDRCGKATDIYKGSFVRGIAKCRVCGATTTVASTVNGANDLKLHAIEYVLDGKRFYKSADALDKDLYNEAQERYFELKEKLNIPDDVIPISASGDSRPQSHGYLKFSELFNFRQLLSLGVLLNEILSVKNRDNREWLLIAFSDCLASNNLLCCYAYDYRKLTPLFSIHAYTVPSRVCENNVIGTDFFGRGTFKKAYEKLQRGKKYGKKAYEVKASEKKGSDKVYTGEVIEDGVTDSIDDFYSKEYATLILNRNSEDLGGISDLSIDMILTDPPYYDNLAYSELSAFYYAWLKKYIKFQSENILENTIYVATQEEKSHELYVQQLSNVFQQCHAKLKDSGIMVFSFHHNKVEAWISLAQAIKRNSFIVTNVFPVRSEGSSAYHSSKESIKWDSIIVLRKKAPKRFIKEISWEKEIEYFISVLQLKKCDFISYYRSLMLKDYVNNDHTLMNSEEINDFFNRDYTRIVEVFTKKGDK